MNKGKIIFLNGVTSTGKTSIAEEIQELADEIYYHISNDMFHCMIGKKFWIKNSRMCVAKSIISMYYAVKGMCENGINVIIDGMLLEMCEYMQEYGSLHYDIMQSVFSEIDVFMVEVFCPLDECRRRNISRGDRGEYQSEQQNEEMNKNVIYNFKVDTSVNSARECAEQILAAENLSELYPVILTEHDTSWKEYYLREEDFLQSIFGDRIIRINHIGSTAVYGLIAKPTIDILLEVSNDIELLPITEIMEENGYIVNTPECDIIMYIKGYTPQGFQGQAVHIHVRSGGDWGELYFRDYLISHPEAADEYAKLKLNLKEKYTRNRDAYTNAKGEFIQKYTELARVEFPNKYTLA